MLLVGFVQLGIDDGDRPGARSVYESDSAVVLAGGTALSDSASAPTDDRGRGRTRVPHQGGARADRRGQKAAGAASLENGHKRDPLKLDRLLLVLLWGVAADGAGRPVNQADSYVWNSRARRRRVRAAFQVSVTTIGVVIGRRAARDPNTIGIDDASRAWVRGCRARGSSCTPSSSRCAPWSTDTALARPEVCARSAARRGRSITRSNADAALVDLPPGSAVNTEWQADFRPAPDPGSRPDIAGGAAQTRTS